jgi:hypothetical protein
VTTFDAVCLAIVISNTWTRNQKNTVGIYICVYKTTQPSKIYSFPIIYTCNSFVCFKLHIAHAM